MSWNITENYLKGGKFQVIFSPEGCGYRIGDQKRRLKSEIMRSVSFWDERSPLGFLVLIGGADGGRGGGGIRRNEGEEGKGVCFKLLMRGGGGECASFLGGFKRLRYFSGRQVKSWRC